MDAGSSQVESSTNTTRPQQSDLQVNQRIAEERTYVELIDDYETINEEPHYHEIADVDVQGRQSTARVI